MSIGRSILYTLLYILISILISCWLLLDICFPLPEFLIENYDFITSLISLPVFLLLLISIRGKSIYHLSDTQFRFYFTGLILGFSFIFIQTPLNLIYNLLFTSDYNIIYEFDLSRLWSLTTISSVLLIPIYEELYFRKFIQKSLQDSLKPYLAIIVSALLFSSIHVPFEAFLGYEYNLHHVYITFFGGLILGLIFYKSKSVLPSILMHSIWNLSVIIL